MVAKKTVAHPAAPAHGAPAAKSAAAKKAGVRTMVAKKTVAPAASDSRARGGPAVFAVHPGESPWSPEEIEQARTGLLAETLRLAAEIEASEAAVAGLLSDSGGGAGDDDADTGSKNITREHEMSLAANSRERIHQAERALERLESGTYGSCESCRNPIGKARMQAFPRAVLCVGCKQRQERR